MPLVPEHKSPKRRSTIGNLANWFVSFQKTDSWDPNKLNRLHVAILTTLVTIYVCHVISSPYIRFIQDNDVIIAIRVIQSLCLVGGVAGMVKMFLVNGSMAAIKMMFTGSFRTYIFIFWIVRAVVVEILKGQILYSFVQFFHACLIYSTDAWYICNRKVLILNMLLFLSVVVYEFFVSISPLGPSKPSWTFVNVKVTANSLSRSTNFNLFVIFLDAFIMVVYDVKRSKFIMLTKKQKRRMVEMDESSKVFVDRLWKCLVVLFFLGLILFVVERAFHVSSTLLDILEVVIVLLGLLVMLVILYYSTNAKAAKAVCFKLVCERRVVFILILTAILAYINLRTFGFTVWAFTNPIVTYSIICMDTIILHFPGKASKVFMTVLIINYLFNIYLYTFLRNDCDQNKLPWGIYGQKISYCNVLRLGFQTILSLMLSAAGATLLGKTHNLFFCNANILRSTGTVDSRSKSFEYVQNIFQEKRGGINVFESENA